MIKEIKECRICGSDVVTVFNLGEIYPSAFVDDSTGTPEQAPLTLVKCVDCGLVQLKHTVDLDSMYRQYWYRAGINKSMVSSLQDVVKDVEGKVNLSIGDAVVDIGCNDGTMFNLYSNHKSLTTVGFDPSLNLADKAKESCNYFVNDYFSAKDYPLNRKAKVVTAIAMFYDLPDPNKFVQDVVSILDDDGIFIIQFTDLLSMFKINAFDNICHEHLEYYSLDVVKKLLEDHGLKIFDILYNNVNGGSIRVSACKKNSNRKVVKAVNNAVWFERGYFSAKTFNNFKDEILNARHLIRTLLTFTRDNGGTVFGLGASTKGNTLLQIFNITNDLIPFIAEVNEEKFGLKTVGTNISIISEEAALKMKPDYFLVLPWHFIDNFVKKLDDYLEDGGKLIVPLPVPGVFYKEDGKLEWAWITILQ